MSKCIPYLNSKKDIKLYRKHFSDSEILFSKIDRVDDLFPKERQKLWLDAGFEGLCRLKKSDLGNQTSTKTPYHKFVSSLPFFDDIVKSGFSSLKKDQIGILLEAFFEKISSYNPSYVSLPQLPYDGDIQRRKINREIAELANGILKLNNYTFKIILPLVIENQSLFTGKVDRNKIISYIGQIQKKLEFGLWGIWIVDEKLQDQIGSSKFKTVRFPRLIDLHQEIRKEFNFNFFAGGPYWALNILLWCRGLIDMPLVGMGANYQYNYPTISGHGNPPKNKVAINCLKRTIPINKGVEDWLSNEIKKLPEYAKEEEEFKQLHKRFNAYLDDPDLCREQIVKFCSEWYSNLEDNSKEGRPLALFQDFSAAFVCGKNKENLPIEGRARRPEIIAEQLMTLCL